MNAFTLPPSTQALVPPTRTTDSGVRHYGTGSLPEIERKGDVYELPVSAPGLPKRITVIPSNFIGFGGHVDAVDASGQHLKVKAWENEVRVTDTRTGITTRLDRNTLDVVVSEPIRSKTRPMPYGVTVTTDCRLEQRIGADGDIRIRTGYHGYQESVGYNPVRDMPATDTHSGITVHDEQYDETLISGTDPIVTRSMETHRHAEPVVKQARPSRIDQSGDLIVTRPDGSEETFHLFVAPHEVRR